MDSQMNFAAKQLLLVCFSVWLLGWAVSSSAQQEDDLEVLNNLKRMSLLDLGRVEIRLDDAFDVFDGLIQAQRTTVATGANQFADRAPSVTTVITAQDIEVMGARTLEEALRAVPGLTVSYNYFNVPVYTIRGISSLNNPEVLMLINGIRVNASYTGGRGQYWSGFPTSMIAQIEVIRGPGSAVYGADAFSGVINVITKTAENIDGTEAGVRFGNFNTQDAWVLHGSQNNGWDISAMLEFSNTDGHQQIVEADAQTALDQAFGTSASLAPGSYGSSLTYYNARFEVSKQSWRLRAGIHHGDDIGAGTGVAQALDMSEPISEKRINVDLTYRNRQFTENWDVEAQASYLHTGFAAAFNIYPPDAFGGNFPIGYIGEPTARENNSQIMLSGFYRGFKNRLIRIGAGFANYDMYETAEVKNFGTDPFTKDTINPLERVDVSDTFAEFIPEISRRNWFIFLQDVWTISPSWELTAGIRYDDYSDFGSTVNPRLGLVWEPRNGLVVKFLYGQAFRAPSFTEQFTQNNPVATGNPHVEPEEIETFEIGFDFRATENLNLALNLFRYEAEDKIGLQPRGGSEFLYTNLSDWEGQGLEFEARWKTSAKSSILFNYSYQDSEDQNTGAKLDTGPRNVIFVRGDYLIGSYWFIDTQINWTSDWFRALNDPREAVDGHTTVDLIVRRRAVRDSKTNIAVGIRNIFDEDVRYPSLPPDPRGIISIPNDLPGADRFYFVEFRYKF